MGGQAAGLFNSAMIVVLAEALPWSSMQTGQAAAVLSQQA